MQRICLALAFFVAGCPGPDDGTAQPDLTAPSGDDMATATSGAPAS